VSNDALPHGWVATTLGNVLNKVVGGGTPSRNIPAYFNGHIPWFTVKDMKVLKPNDAQEHITNKAISESATNLIPANTLIVATRIALGKAIRPTVTCAINQDLKALMLGSGMNSDFMLHWIGWNERVIQDFGSGTTVSGIRLETLHALKLDLPPSEEQNRIVDKLEELLSDLDAGVNELKAAQKKLGQYRQSLLKAAVEGELTAEWRAKRKLATHPTSSSSPSRRGPTPTIKAKSLDSRLHGNDIPFVGPTEVGTTLYQSVATAVAPTTMNDETGAQLLQRILKERRTRWETKQLAKYKAQNKTPPTGWKEKYPEPVKPDTSELPTLPQGWVWTTLSQIGWLDRGRSKHRPRNAPHLYGGPYPFVQTGDIRHADTFITSVESSYSEAGLAQSRLWPTGTICITIAANIGKTAILGIEACFPDSVVGFLPATEDVSSRFVEYFLRTAQQKLEDEAPATAQKNINLEILEKVCVPLPPIDEQQRIVEILVESFFSIGNQENSITIGLKQSAAQRKNILKAAFSGQLVPQNPNDEPASVLLERIRTERTKKIAPAKKSAPKKTITKKKITKKAKSA
jgi:type I restriction enzyme, S subunit